MDCTVAGCRHNMSAGSILFHPCCSAWPLEDSGFQGKPVTHTDVVMTGGLD